MRNWLRNLFVLTAVVTMLFGCTSGGEQQPETKTSSDEESSEQVEQTIVITISEDEGANVINEKEITIEDNQILMDVLKKEFEIEEENGFITGIEGIVADESEKEAWALFVNDEMAMVGASDYELQFGDHVVLDLQKWE